MNDPHRFNQSLAKGLAILEFIAAHDGVTTLTGVSNALNIDKATAKRFLNTLEQLGYITSNQYGKTFSITLKSLQIGYSAISNLEWRSIAKFYLERLFAELGETISLCILDGPDILYLLRLNRANFQPLDTSTGSRRPAYASAMGKMLLAMEPPERARELIDSMHMRQMTPHTVKGPEALLAQLQEARTKGYAICDQEVSELTRSISAPIMNGDKALAAFAIAVRVDDYSVEEMEERMAPRALACTAEISLALKQVEYRIPPGR